MENPITDVWNGIKGIIKTGMGILDAMGPNERRYSQQLKNVKADTRNRGNINYKMHNIKKLPYKECAQFVNRYFKMEGKGGSAWSHNYVSPYINGYEGIKEHAPGIGNDYARHISYNMDAADNFKSKFNINMLDPNKSYVANMYFNGSPWDYKTRMEGNSFAQGSHTGVVLYNKDKNQWVVRHNYHGNLMEDPLEDLIGSKYNLGITSISIPKKKFGGKIQIIGNYKRIN